MDGQTPEGGGGRKTKAHATALLVKALIRSLLLLQRSPSQTVDERRLPVLCPPARQRRKRLSPPLASPFSPPANLFLFPLFLHLPTARQLTPNDGRNELHRNMARRREKISIFKNGCQQMHWLQNALDFCFLCHKSLSVFPHRFSRDFQRNAAGGMAAATAFTSLAGSPLSL
uniref:Uncharacterized protein n=1 Tax=Globodera rostochiensis TaxID=31243 RepID=A0A914I0J5_GLORO